MQYMKRIVCLLIAVIIVLSLVACGDSFDTVVEEVKADDFETEETKADISDNTTVEEASDGEPTNQFGDPTNHQPVSDDELLWNFDENSETLTFSGSGQMKDYDKNDEAPWDVYAEEVQIIVLEDGITSIGDNAFDGYWELTSVSLPDTIEYIGENAFSYSGGWEIQLPFALKEIGAYAFYTCDTHTPLVIPEGVEIVGRGAFLVNEFVDTVSIPSSVRFIGEKAFSNDFHIHDFIVDSENAYYTAVDGVLYNKEMTVLMNYPSLKEEPEFIIPDSVERISDMAFINNYFLKKITIPKSVKEAGDTSLFMAYSALEEFVVEDGSEIFKADDRALMSKDGTILYHYPMMNKAEEYSIPDGVEFIGEGAFMQTWYLKKLYFPEGIKEVRQQGCQYMNGTELYLPESFTDTVKICDYEAFSSTDESGMIDYAAGFTYHENEPYGPTANSNNGNWRSMKLHYAGASDEWELFSNANNLTLESTEVICDK